MQVRKIDESEWRDFVDNCPSATFFHTPDWYKVWKDHFGWEIEARHFIFKSGSAALLPLCSRKRLKGFIKEYFSGPVGTYGGIITNTQLSKEEVILLERYLHNFNALQIRMNPFNSILEDTFFTEKDFTQTIALSQEWKSILRSWSKSHSRSIKKGIREGVKISVASKNDWKHYYDIYQDSRKRWGEKASNNYSWDLFKILSQLSPTVCKLWLAYKDEKIISGCLCFYCNQHVVYWHGASLSTHFHLKPAHVLQHHIIKHAAEEGYQWYDFNPSGGHEGVVNFKAGFGAEIISSHLFINKSSTIHHIENLKKRFTD